MSARNITKCVITSFVKTDKAIDDPITKFGGQPNWAAEACWPLSKETGNPMGFICQILLDNKLFPGGKNKIAYIFMTDGEDFVDGTWEPDSGENAVIIQTISDNIQHNTASDLLAGPTLEAEYKVECEFAQESLEGEEEYGNKIGGEPDFIQGEEYPDGGGWQLLLQLDSTEVPFEVNFGDAGIGYAFINKDCTEGKFLWQCH